MNVQHEIDLEVLDKAAQHWPAVLQKATKDAWQYHVLLRSGLQFVAESATPADEAGAFVLFHGVRIVGVELKNLSPFLDRGLTVALSSIVLVAEASS